MKAISIFVASALAILSTSALANRNDRIQQVINSTGGNCPAVTRVVDSNANTIYVACSNGERFAILIQGDGGKVLNCRVLARVGGRCEL
jgi:hypothetical protein